MMNGIYLMDKVNFKNVYGNLDKEIISKYLNIKDKVYTRDDLLSHPSLLNEIDVIMSSWGAPLFNKELLLHAPNLKAVFYGAGSVKSIVSDAFWKRNIILTSAWSANAIPVAEFAFAQIILSLKNMWLYFSNNKRIVCAGAYKSKVGLISLGMIGKLVLKKLQSLDVKVYVYDPFISDNDAKEYGVNLCSLDEIFSNCDVISLHTPLFNETINMINKRHFTLMKSNATFINTARGAIVNEKDLIDVFSKRTDIIALLDVTHPEPPIKNSPLYTLPNIFITPHVAGSMDSECERMGHYATKELVRWMNNKPLLYQITKESLKNMA